MSLQTQHLFEFGEFRLDLVEKRLKRGDTVIPVTPKVFETLQILAENAGHLVEKDELMQRIWQDRFVEEGNLAFNIRMLRKALGDNAAHPRFIETVPRRGYRFVAEVTVPSNGNGLDGEALFQSASGAAERREPAPRVRALTGTAVLLVVAVIFGSTYFLVPTTADTVAPILSSTFASQQLTTNGKVILAIVTPDGRNVIYTDGNEGAQSVWIRDLETSNNVEIIRPSNDQYFGLAVSPDAKFLYFVRRPKTDTPKDLYRVSIFGGIPTKIASNTEGDISISPDGQKVSFVRCPYTDEEYCSLWIAEASTGNDPKKLISRPLPIRFGPNEFSPDGKSIAIAVGQSQNGSKEFGLEAVDLESGAERELSPEKFFNIRSIAWLPNGSSLLITTSQVPTKYFRIWEVSAVTGDVSPLTTDSENYNRLSLSDSGDVLVSTQVKQDFQLFVLNGDDAAATQPLADASQVAFAANGRIYYSSIMSGNDEIWSMNADGSDRRQLTNDPAVDGLPTVSGGDLVFFASTRSGSVQVWRMNADGSDQIQITQQEGGLPLTVSKDGKWVFYRHGLQRTLWRVSTSGGHEENVFDKRLHEVAVSPDGSQVAYFERRGRSKVLEIASLADGKATKTFEFDDQTPPFNKVSWKPDGKGLIYVLSAFSGTRTLWFQPIENGPPVKVADLGTEGVNSISVGPDGKSIAMVKGGWKHDAVLIRGLR